MPRPITPEAAHAIYLVLRLVGAPKSAQENFVSMLSNEGPPPEWRFMGVFGFGGKFWLNNSWWYISCYVEDEDETNLYLIKTCNELLAVLYEKFKRPE